MGVIEAQRFGIYFVRRKQLIAIKCVVLSFRVCLQNFRYLGKRNIVR